MNIVWSDEAAEDYHQNIDYLLAEWSEKSAAEFIEDVASILELLKTQPKLYPLTDSPSVRKAVIRKQITLFYKIEKQNIHLIRFWNNRQNPEKLKP